MEFPDPCPFEDFGGRGETLHFAHANGFPPSAYHSFLKILASNYHVMAMRMRPLWTGSIPEELSDWRLLSDDLRHFLDQHNFHDLIGVGHSMGATATLRLALTQPDRFNLLVLIDPVLYPPYMSRLWNLIFRTGLAYRVHPFARNALKRRRYFSDRIEMFENYRCKSIFNRISDDDLRCYVDSIACKGDNENIKLCFPAEWEARIYVTAIIADLEIWRNLAELKPPLLLIRGDETNTFWSYTLKLFLKNLPKTQILIVPGATHLAPMEKPDLIASAILGFIDGIHSKD
jgi:pimeloyl-ACP methyl ester carboxylesterase